MSPLGWASVIAKAVTFLEVALRKKRQIGLCVSLAADREPTHARPYTLSYMKAGAQDAWRRYDGRRKNGETRAVFGVNEAKIRPDFTCTCVRAVTDSAFSLDPAKSPGP